MSRATIALVAFLLIASSLAVLPPLRPRKTVAQESSSEWTGRISIQSYPIFSEVIPGLGCVNAGDCSRTGILSSASFSLAVTSSGQILGSGSGSYLMSIAFPSGPGSSVSCNVGYVSFREATELSVTGQAYSNGSARLVFTETNTLTSGIPEVSCSSSLGSNASPGEPAGSTTTEPPFTYTVELAGGLVQTFASPFTDIIQKTTPNGQPLPSLLDSAVIALEPVEHTSVSCYPSQQLVGGAVNCQAEVFGNNPSGTVKWSLNSGPASLESSSCLLSSDPVDPAYSSCQFSVNGQTEGDFEITAHYTGDRNNIPSDAPPYDMSFIKLEIDRASTRLGLSCDPSVVNGTLQASCTAEVTPAPASGNVTWTASYPAGIITNSSCTLAAGSCSASYFQANASAAVTISASYSGDALHDPSGAASTISVLSVGTGTLDQRQTTGFVIKVAGTTGSAVNASSTYYYTQPNDTGKAPFASNEYYDLKVFGTLNGEVQACHYGANVNASTSIDYYYNGIWNSATNVVATAGVSVCGDIPPSALLGTPLDVGGMTSTITSTTSSSTSPTTVSSSSLTTSSTTPVPVSATSSTSTSLGSTGSGGGIPEFPFQILLLPFFTVLIVISYLLVRRQKTMRRPFPL